MDRTQKFCAALVATRNRWPLLITRALPSVAAQTKRPDRLVLVNDGIPFSLAEQAKLEELLSPIPLTILHNSHTPGAAGAWNTGLEFLAARGAGGFVAILDDDDQWDAHHLADCQASADAEGSDIVVSGLRLIRDGLEQTRPLPSHLSDRDFLIGNPGWQGSNTFVSLDALERVGQFREGLLSLNDRDLAIRLLRLEGIRIAYTGCWSSSWHVCSDGQALSRPKGTEKLSGLRWFWRIYGSEMTAQETRCFFDRAETLFGISEADIQTDDKDALSSFCGRLSG